MFFKSRICEKNRIVGLTLSLDFRMSMTSDEATNWSFFHYAKHQQERQFAMEYKCAKVIIHSR